MASQVTKYILSWIHVTWAGKSPAVSTYLDGRGYGSTLRMDPYFANTALRCRSEFGSEVIDVQLCICCLWQHEAVGLWAHLL